MKKRLVWRRITSYNVCYTKLLRDAFDLTRILPISASSTPFSAAWYLRYDSISSIELWDGTQWTAVTAPASGWIVNGAFAGYTLTSAQQASTQGVRITLVENTAARHAAATLGASYDPYAPAAGTGRNNFV